MQQNNIGLLAIVPVIILTACFPVQDKTSWTEIQVVTVGPRTVTCQSVIEQQCLIVDGEYFYDTIKGFTHRPGIQSTLEIERRQVCGADGLPECPADAGLYAYVLKRVVAESPA